MSLIDTAGLVGAQQLVLCLDAKSPATAGALRGLLYLGFEVLRGEDRTAALASNPQSDAILALSLDVPEQEEEEGEKEESASVDNGSTAFSGVSSEGEEEEEEDDEEDMDWMFKPPPPPPKCQRDEDYTAWECPEDCDEKTRAEAASLGLPLPPAPQVQANNLLSSQKTVDDTNVCFKKEVIPMSNMCPKPCTLSGVGVNKKCTRQTTQIQPYCPTGYVMEGGRCKKTEKVEKIAKCPKGCIQTTTIRFDDPPRRLQADGFEDDEELMMNKPPGPRPDPISCTRTVKVNDKDCPAGFLPVKKPPTYDGFDANANQVGANDVSANTCTGPGCPGEVGYKAVKGECSRILTMSPEVRCPVNCKRDAADTKNFTCWLVDKNSTVKCPNGWSESRDGTKCVKYTPMPKQYRCPEKTKDNVKCVEQNGKCIAWTTAPITWACPAGAVEESQKTCTKTETIKPNFKCPAKCTINKDSMCEGPATAVLPWTFTCPKGLKLITGNMCK
eukprot:GDKI01043168.1.p1 GENE.GDKI01043168.1~~GDKI01043168.1.p1  ORF type:complete len:500 (-),score=163.34 GDKI01043168.1:490-1989(-)